MAPSQGTLVFLIQHPHDYTCFMLFSRSLNRVHLLLRSPAKVASLNRTATFERQKELEIQGLMNICAYPLLHPPGEKKKKQLLKKNSSNSRKWCSLCFLNRKPTPLPGTRRTAFGSSFLPQTRNRASHATRSWLLA